jgi:hypothetical protein
MEAAGETTAAEGGQPSLWLTFCSAQEIRTPLLAHSPWYASRCLLSLQVPAMIGLLPLWYQFALAFMFARLKVTKPRRSALLRIGSPFVSLPSSASRDCPSRSGCEVWKQAGPGCLLQRPTRRLSRRLLEASYILAAKRNLAGRSPVPWHIFAPGGIDLEAQDAGDGNGARRARW